MMGELNIALNTIAYILIFIFPGLLFRKFLFIRYHSKQFNQGNLFERFLWTLFSSVLILVTIGIIFLISRNYLKIPILDSISYKTIKNLFLTLSKNNLPEEQEIKAIYKDFVYLLSAIYLLSCILGLISHYTLNSKFLKSIGIFKFNNYWQDLIKGAYKVDLNDDSVYSYTLVDVLVETNEGNKLYSGIIKDYFLSPSNGELEVIVLKDVKRYKKLELEDNSIETVPREIPGDNFCIEKSRILNLNFSYVSELKESNRFYKGIKIILNIIYILSLIIIGVLMFVSKDFEYLFNIPRKITFFICSIFIILILREYLENLLTGRFISKFKLEDINLVLFFSVPYIWIFNFIEWYVVIIIQFLLLLLLSFFVKKQATQNADGKNISNDL